MTRRGISLQGLLPAPPVQSEPVSDASRLKDADGYGYWAWYGRSMMDRVYDGMSKATGRPLTDAAKRALHAAFVDYVEASPAMTRRYECDPTVADDFVQFVVSNFLANALG